MKKSLIIAAGLLVAVLAGAAGFVIMRKPAPPPPESSPQDLGKYLASNQFSNLKDEDKEAYLDKVMKDHKPGESREGWESLSDEEKDALRKNMGSFFRAQMTKRVDKYFELPPEKRKEYLDDMIDRMQKFRDGHGPMGPGKDSGGPGPEGHGPGGPGGPGGQGFSPERMKEMIESTPPEERAKFEEFMKDLHERAKERGVGPGRP